MPGFFDFGGFDPLAEMNPAMSGQNTPLMDDVEQAGNYDFMGNVPQMPQGPASSGTPYNALAAMSGIEMPQMPQQDSMVAMGSLTISTVMLAGSRLLASCVVLVAHCSMIVQTMCLRLQLDLVISAGAHSTRPAWRM